MKKGRTTTIITGLAWALGTAAVILAGLLHPATAAGAEGTNWVYQVRPPRTAALRDFQGLFECRPDHQIGCPYKAVVEMLGESLRFPRPVKVTVEECPAEIGANAFYRPSTHDVTLCYQLAGYMHDRFVEDGKTPSQAGMLTRNALLHILLHELGHLAIGELDLGVMGREEDAVDQFATLSMIQLGLPQYAVDGATAHLVLGKPAAGQPLPFHDEHSLGPQRFYDTLCTLYGSDPERFSLLVPSQLPPERGARCPNEYMRQNKAWETALNPFARTGAPSAPSAVAQPAAAQSVDFAGTWAGKAMEQTPQGTLEYEVNAVIQAAPSGYKVTFGGRTKVPTAAGPTDVLLNGEGIETSVINVQGTPTLRIAVRQLVTTVLATGERAVDVGNTYYMQRTAAGQLSGRDETNLVRIQLAQRAGGASAAAPAGGDIRAFAGNWVGQAKEKTPEGIVTYEVNLVISGTGQATFGGRATMNSPAGPLDVILNGTGVKTSVTAVQGVPTLRLEVQQLVTTVLATGERQPQPGGAFLLQIAGRRLAGRDLTGDVEISLERR